MREPSWLGKYVMTHLNVSLGPDAGIMVPSPAQRPASFKIGSPAEATDPTVAPINVAMLPAQIEAAKRYARPMSSPVVVVWGHVLPRDGHPGGASAQTGAELRQGREHRWTSLQGAAPERQKNSSKSR